MGKKGLTLGACAGVARLFDLVRCREAALQTAFFYALGDTLVAQDLEQASRIAYGRDKRWARAVTLQVGRPAGPGCKSLCQMPSPRSARRMRQPLRSTCDCRFARSLWVLVLLKTPAMAAEATAAKPAADRGVLVPPGRDDH